MLLATAILLSFLLWSILNWSSIVGTVLILALLVIWRLLRHVYICPPDDENFIDYGVKDPLEIEVKSCFPKDFQSVSYDEQSLRKILPKNNLIKDPECFVKRSKDTLDHFALLVKDPESERSRVYFCFGKDAQMTDALGEQCNIFDTLVFASKELAREELESNGFKPQGKMLEWLYRRKLRSTAKLPITWPSPVAPARYTTAHQMHGLMYSSGGFWKSQD